MRWAIALLIFVIVAATSPQQADAVPRESHCVLVVLDQRLDGEFVMSSPVCFADEASADTWVASGGASTMAAVSDSDGVVASSTFTLGKHFDGYSGSGSSIRIVGGECSGGWWNTSSWWDNRISSSYNGCARLTHWDNANKSGSAESTYGSGTTDNLTYMNNKAESVSYHSG